MGGSRDVFVWVGVKIRQRGYKIARAELQDAGCSLQKSTYLKVSQVLYLAQFGLSPEEMIFTIRG